MNTIAKINSDMRIDYVYTQKQYKSVFGFTIIGTFIDCRKDEIYHNILYGISRMKLNETIIDMICDKNITEINIFNKNRKHIWNWSAGEGCKQLCSENVVATKLTPICKMLKDRDIKGDAQRLITRKILKGDIKYEIPKIESRRNKRTSGSLWVKC